jgi:hypothetical protein
MKAAKLRRDALGGLAAALLAVPVVGGCATTPGEVERLRVENELLREQLRIVRSNCSYYRDVEMEVDETPAPAAP